MSAIYDLLKGGDLRSIGKSNEVVELICNNQKLFDEVFEGIFNNDPVVRARSADAIEKAAAKNRKLIQKQKKVLLKNLSKFKQKEVVWHIALILGYLRLTKKELEKVFAHLFKWLETEESIIVKVCCLQSLAFFAEQNIKLQKVVVDEIEKQMLNDAPAIKARGRHLLADFDKLKSSQL